MGRVVAGNAHDSCSDKCMLCNSVIKLIKLLWLGGILCWLWHTDFCTSRLPLCLASSSAFNSEPHPAEDSPQRDIQGHWEVVR